MGGVMQEVQQPSHAGETEVQALPHHHMSHMYIDIYTDRVVVYKSHPVTWGARQQCYDKHLHLPTPTGFCFSLP